MPHEGFLTGEINDPDPRSPWFTPAVAGSAACLVRYAIGQSTLIIVVDLKA